MKVHVYAGASEFLARTHIELEKNEAANNLLLGLVAQPSDFNTVRRIVETTINRIYPLYYPNDVVRFFLDHHAPESILADINAGCVYIFDADSVVIGTGTIHGREIARVFVLPEYQGRGYGSAIMKTLEEMVFRTHQIVRLDSSLPAFDMYLKRGYKARSWHTIVTPGGQVLCYHQMEKENSQELCDSSSPCKEPDLKNEIILVRPFNPQTDRIATIELWNSVFAYDAPHNEPGISIDNKVAVSDGLFYVACNGNEIVGTVMAGYDGHRGWIYSLAVKPDQQKQGIGKKLMARAEAALRELKCIKINLQVLDTNTGIVEFYKKLGYVVEPRVSMGKLLKSK